MDQLTPADNRTYTVTLREGGRNITELVQLNVYYRLTAPSLNVSSIIRPVEGNNLTLLCDAGPQTVLSFYFYRNNQILFCGEDHVTCDLSSPLLYFDPILGSDNGSYTCGISNPVSRAVSPSIVLDVAVPVSGVTLRGNTTAPVIANKEAIALVCSSSGTDISYDWRLKGSPLPKDPRYLLTGGNSTLLISPVSRNDGGDFMCTVSNYLNSERSNTLSLTWFPEGHIECGAERVGDRVSLYCAWPGGRPSAEVSLTHENITQRGTDIVTAELRSHQVSLGKQLTCTGSHVVSSDSCSLVIDIPQSYGFTNGSNTVAPKGSSAFLSVSLNTGKARAAQIFPAKFSWFHLNPSPSELFSSGNVSIISNDFSSFLIIPHMSKEFNGQYLCRAENVIGGNSFTFYLSVEEEEILSAGAIAGIVIGSVAALALVALVLVLYSWRHRRSQKDEGVPQPPPSNQYLESPSPASGQ
ncbi:V-set and immunoglobulin domain-containing protein 10-like, partial [Leptodactylus fuscus]|uniref:V-set and immunoglobulin domain-containing protein 10-like n=1 Tax=Leptodactylus fuscus TaxID=238119 RepID=UPI003F4F27AF